MHPRFLAIHSVLLTAFAAAADAAAAAATTTTATTGEQAGKHLSLTQPVATVGPLAHSISLYLSLPALIRTVREATSSNLKDKLNINHPAVSLSAFLQSFLSSSTPR